MEPIHEACWQGDLDAVKENIAFKNVRDSTGRTPLAISAASGNVALVKFLLESKVDVNCPERNGFTALHMLTPMGRPSLKMMKLLIDNGADINAKDCDGQTPLHSHVNSRNPCRAEIVNLLVKSGADCDAKNDDGQTPLHLAVMGPKPLMRVDKKVVEALLRAGADPNATDDLNITPLHAAIYAGHTSSSKVDIISSLLYAGADPSLFTGGLSAVAIAAYATGSGSLETMKRLIALLQPHQMQEHLDAALRVAVGVNNAAMVRLLLYAGADRTAKTKRGAVIRDLIVKDDEDTFEEVVSVLDKVDPPPMEQIRRRRDSLKTYYIDSRRCLAILARRCEKMDSNTTSEQVVAQLGDLEVLPEHVLYHISTLIHC